MAKSKNVKIVKRIEPKLNVELSEELSIELEKPLKSGEALTIDNDFEYSSIERWSIDFGVDYKIMKELADVYTPKKVFDAIQSLADKGIEPKWFKYVTNEYLDTVTDNEEELAVINYMKNYLMK